MSSQFQLRPAVDGDYESLYDIIKRAQEPHIVRAFGKYDETAERAHFDEVTRIEHHEIVDVEGTRAGCVCAIDRPHELRIARIFLYPEFQGRGIGTQLVRSLIARARKRGVQARLRVLTINPARRLYEREGFVISATSEHFHTMIWTPPATR